MEEKEILAIREFATRILTLCQNIEYTFFQLVKCVDNDNSCFELHVFTYNILEASKKVEFYLPDLLFSVPSNIQHIEWDALIIFYQYASWPYNSEKINRTDIRYWAGFVLENYFKRV